MMAWVIANLLFDILQIKLLYLKSDQQLFLKVENFLLENKYFLLDLARLALNTLKVEIADSLRYYFAKYLTIE
jgi:hypothetical protein